MQDRRTTARIHRIECEIKRVESTPEAALRHINANRESLTRRYGAEEIANLEKKLRESNKGLSVNRDQWILMAFKEVQQHADAINSMLWRIENAGLNREFISSDNPVFVRRPGHPMDPSLVGILKEELGAELYCSVSPTQCLIASWRNKLPPSKRRKLAGCNPGIIPNIQASAQHVDAINKMTFLMAHRFVFSARPLASKDSLITECKDFSVTIF